MSAGPLKPDNILQIEGVISSVSEMMGKVLPVVRQL
jgi:hypothetical protein